MHRTRSATRARPTLCLAALAGLLMSGAVEAKTPGSQYCFLGVCHRVLTLAETKALIGKPRPMHASHYDSPARDRFNPSLLTSSGEVFRPDAPDNAASPIYPDGTQIAVFAPSTKRGAIVRINNAGPYYGNRLLDLSRATAERLGFAHNGVGRVIVEVLAEPSPAEARYVRSRRYAPVAGYIGKVAAIEDIRANWAQRQVPRVVVAAQAPVRPAVPPVSPPVVLLQAVRPAPADRLAQLDLTLPKPAFDLTQAPPMSIPALHAQFRRVPLLAARESKPQGINQGIKLAYSKATDAAPLGMRR